MTNPYGPWATAIDPGRNPQLSAFWRQRLTMLVPTSKSSAVLSKRNLLGLVVAAALIGVLPTFYVAPAVAEQAMAIASGIKESDDARTIIDRMAKVYAGCKTYVDSGVVTIIFFEAAGKRTVERPFTTAFVRTDRFRYEFRERLYDEPTRYIIWSNQKQVQTWWDIKPGIEKSTSLGLALGAAAGVSGRSSTTIPKLLFPDVPGPSLTALTNVKRAADGTIGKVQCSRIEGLYGGQPITVWIDKKTCLVRRIDKRTTFDTFRTEQTTTYDPTLDEEIAGKLLEFDPPVARPPEKGAR